MLRRSHLRLATLGAVLALAGCATKDEIPFDRAAPAPKRIGLVTMHFPERAHVILASSIGQSFGLIGGLVDAGMASGREDVFAEIAAAQHFTAQTAFRGSLVADLEARGYTVVDVKTTRQDETGFLWSYPRNSEPQVDAYLDIFVSSYGYVAAGIGSSTPYRPEAWANVRLVSAKDSSILMNDTVLYNPLAARERTVTIAPDPAYTFTDWDTLKAHPIEAVKGAGTALDQMAGAIAKLL